MRQRTKALVHANLRADAGLTARLRVERPAGSASEVHAFERRDGAALVFGWLRSAPDPRGAGSAPVKDERRETVTIAIPGAAARTLTVLDAKGDARPGTARLDGGRIAGVELRGDRVFIGVIAR